MAVRRQMQRMAGIAVDPEAREKDDFYATPPYATERFLEREKFDGPVWEFACGEGDMSRVLEAAGYTTISTDLVDRKYGTPRVDFLLEQKPLALNGCTNPPFKLANKFILHAHALGMTKFAMLLRLSALEGKTRKIIHRKCGLARVYVFSERVSMQRGGGIIEQGDGNGMFAYAWFVWERGHEGPWQGDFL